MSDSTILVAPLGHLRILKIYVFYDGPQIISSISSSGQKYFAMNVVSGEDADTWYFVPINDERLVEIETNVRSIRDAFVGSQSGIVWEVKLKYKGCRHTARHINVAELDYELLPKDGVFLDYDEDEDCFSNLETSEEVCESNPLLMVTRSADEEAEALNKEVIDLSLEPNGTHKQSIEAEQLGLTLLRTQALLKSQGLSGLNIRNQRQKKMYEDKLTMDTIGFYAASFGIRLVSKHDVGMFPDSPAPITEAIEVVMRLLDHPSDEKTEIIKTLDYRTLSRYRFFLKTLKKHSTSVKINWSSPKRISKRIELSLADISSNLELLEMEEKSMVGTLALSGRLTMIDSQRNSFRFLDSEDQIYTGKIAEELQGIVFHVNCTVNIELEEVLEINPTTQEENSSFTLIKVEYPIAGNESTEIASTSAIAKDIGIKD